MSDAEKKQAWYIANAQGYCLEFRLSENTVNSYATYKTERDKAEYVNNGWKPLKDWLVSADFKCSWSRTDLNSLGKIPKKDGSTVLWDEIVNSLKTKVSSSMQCLIGVHGGDVDKWDTSTSLGNDADGDGAIPVWVGNGDSQTWTCDDVSWSTWNAFTNKVMVFVRPYL